MRVLKLIRAVLWSLIGIRRRADAAKELEGARPGTIVLAALLVLALVIATIVSLVHFLTGDRSRSRGLAPESAVVSAPKRHGPIAVRDTMGERVAPCVQCHTGTAEPTKDGFSPRIAGKPAGYLFNQLVSFRDGRRTYPPMVYLLQNLSDDYLKEMAEYFSRLELPHPPPETHALSPAQAERAVELVRRGDPARKVPACAECHGKSLAGMEPHVPGVLGLPRQYMNAQFGSWRSGRTRSIEPDCMGEVARRLAPEDAVLLASWLASQPVPAGTKAERGGGTLPLDCGIANLSPAPAPTVDERKARGAYLVAAGDCVACHTSLGGAPFAGGRAIETPFGMVYSTNITPDPATGIGRWSGEDFWRALHEGRSKDGRMLYPAFPYPNFTQVTREDADAMFEYLRGLPAASRANTPHALRFPYGTQAALGAWRAAFFRSGSFRPDATRNAEWNRGAYLVRGLGHCDACHAGRNVLGATSQGLDLGGGLIPMQNWYAPSLIAPAGGAPWHADDLVALLKSGVSRRGAAMGPMAEVVYRSTQHLTPADVRAVAAYLESSQADTAQKREPVNTDARAMQRGALVYGEHCARCHGDAGEGAWPAYPPLARNPSVTAPLPANAIKAVLHGGYAPATAANPRPYGMPPYAGRLTEQDVAAVLTYVRASWDNAAGPVSAVEVERYR